MLYVRNRTGMRELTKVGVLASGTQGVLAQLIEPATSP